MPPRKKAESAAAAYDPKAPLPEIIPKVTFDSDTGEPIIAKEEVHHPSPVPRSIAIVLLILAGLSVAYNAVQQYQRNGEADRTKAQVQANKELLAKYAHQQGVIDQNEQRLEDLVLAISTAKTPGQVSAAIQRFLKQSAQAHQQEQKYQQEHPGYRPSSYSQPAPRQSSSSQGSPSPRPTSSRSSSPSPSRSPSPKQSSPPASVCVKNVGCVTVPPTLNAGTQLAGESVSTPVAQQRFTWNLIALVAALTVGTLHLIYGSHPDPLQSGIGAHAPNRKERV